MEVFISWSGNRSEKVAEALRDWLPSVIQSVKPFMSASDIDKGARWSMDLANHLEEAQFGLICLTQDNLEAPWLLFEAGALSKFIDNSRVVPYLHRITPTQVQGPLAQFEAAAADKPSTLDVLKSINGAMEGSGLDPARLEDAFETWWPRLEEKLSNIPQVTRETQPSREDRDILEEILRLCRQMSRQSAPSLETELNLRRHFATHNAKSDDADLQEGFDTERFPTVSELMRRDLDRIGRRRPNESLRRLADERISSQSYQKPRGDGNNEEHT